MKTLEPFLAEHPFFKDLEPRYLELLTGCASNVKFEAGEKIFREGELANHFYVVRHGKVALKIHDTKRGLITIQTIEAGEVFGWSWLFPPYHWRFDAEAVELTRALALDGECLRGKADADHSLGYELYKRFVPVITERLNATLLQLMDVYNK